MILFKAVHVPMILADTKTQTRRMGKKRWNVGAIHQAKTSYAPRTRFADLRILRVWKERLGDISPEDANAEGYPTPSDYLTAFCQINHTTMSDEIMHMAVWAIEFKRERTAVEVSR